MRGGTISNAICYAKDWELLTNSLSGTEQGDFIAFTFDAVDPKDIFKGFSVQPQLWGTHKIEGGMINQSTAFGGARSRPVDCPVGGLQERLDFSNQVMDHLEIRGAFQESRILHNWYAIDCMVGLSLNNPTGFHWNQFRPNQVAHLRYKGSVSVNFIVFSRSIEDELVQLVIIDVR